MALKREKAKNLQFFLYISPWLLGLSLFGLIPLVASLGLSFTDYDLLSTPSFVGLDNFIELFTDTPEFPVGIGNTFYFTFFRVGVCLVLSIFLAVLLNTQIRGSRILRTMYYLPSVLPFISGALLWLYMFNTDFGFLNIVLTKLGLPRIDWFSVDNAMNSIILMSVWGGIGPTTTYVLAGLQTVPLDLYESMDLDGANAWQKFWAVTLPMISPTVFYLVITGIIGCLQEFASIMLLTGGGPMNATTTMTYQIYSYAFDSRMMGFASAYSWIVFLIILVFTVLFFKFGGKAVYYEGEETA